MSSLTNRVATLLSPRYRLVRALGSGGAAYVFVADDRQHNRRVAIKVLREELAATLSAERFLAEINTTAHLRHPNIVPLLDSGTAEGLPFYVMPLVEGESIRARLNRGGPMSVGETLHIVAQIAAALDYAHQRRVIHRDIKPENVILGAGRAVVLDFGIALALDAIESPRWTLPGRVPGTAEYMSPEQASGVTEIDGRSDVYSLACVAYEMISGQPPFTGPLSCVLYRHIHAEPVPLADRCAGVSLEFSRVVSRALAKVPDDRHPTAGAFVADLRTALDGGSPGATGMAATGAPSVNRMLYSVQ
jgi:serine/threonine-protein kinase